MYGRAFTPEARQQLTAGLRSSDAFTVRRCQILLASARGQRPATIARHLGCATQSVRNALHAFDTHGLAALHARSRRPKRTRLETILIADEAYPAPPPSEGTGQLPQPEAIDRVLVIAHEGAPAL
jgi:hypothetical protein